MPASSALGGDTIGVVPTSCDRYHLPPRGRTDCSYPSSCRCFQPPRTRWNDHKHSLSYLPIRPKLSFKMRTRTSSANSSPKTPASNVRSVFYRQIPWSAAPTDVDALLLGPPLVSWFCHQEPSFRHGFTHTRYVLDPNTLTVLHRGPRATCRLSTSTVE